MRAPRLALLLLSLAGGVLGSACRGGHRGSTVAPATSPTVAVPPTDGGPPAPRGARLVDPGASQGTPRQGGTLRVALETEPPTLNPLVEHDYWTSWIALGPIYEPLVRQDPATSAFEPALATSWSEERRRLRFVLRRGVTWHDGRPFVAEDVLQTFRRVRQPGAAPDARASLSSLRTVELDRAAPPGETAVVLTFDAPAPLALQAIARIPILAAHCFAPGDLRTQPASRAPVGTGPFRFGTWQPGVRITLLRHPAYWGWRPYLDGVELRVVRDREAAFELLRRGELDLIWQLTPSQVERALSDPSLASARLVPFYLPRYAFVVWNTRVPPLDDARVRRALAHLVDRDRYLATVYRGRARLVTGPYLPGSDAYDTTLAPYLFDPARAAALLDEAGLRDHDGDGVRELPGGRPFRITFLLTAGSTTLEPLATRMQQDFRRAGVTLDVVPVEWAQQLDRLRKHAFEVSALMWTDVKPLQDNAPYFLSTEAEGGQNYGGWSNPHADRIFAELAVTAPGGDRAALDRRLHRLVHEEQPYTFLGSPEADSLISARVGGYRPDSDGPGFPRIWVDDGAAATGGR